MIGRQQIVRSLREGVRSHEQEVALDLGFDSIGTLARANQYRLPQANGGDESEKASFTESLVGWPVGLCDGEHGWRGSRGDRLPGRLM